MFKKAEFKTEDDVKINFLIPLLKKLGYAINCIDFNKSIEIQEGRKRKIIHADLVIYESNKKKSPLIVCETKGPNEVLDKFVKEQAISYARLLPKIAPLALITNGSQTQVYQTLNKNRIGSLPRRNDLDTDIVNFIVSQDVQDGLRWEAKHKLFIIDDVQTFKSILKSCHNEIRNNEGYDPTVAFDEMSKILFCKLYEEKENPKNNRFRLSIFDDTLERIGVNVVKQILEETKNNALYSGLFLPDATINLHDRTIRKIVKLFEDYDLSLTGFDIKGEAFEYFLSDTFTGGLGEYFTPRNIVEFIVEAIDPKIGDKIVDPFCGTGGFLIYAFEVINEKIRMQDFSENEKSRWRVQLSNESLFGTDWKERTSQACKMNMMVHGDGSAGVFMHHGLLDVETEIIEGKFNICLTNPPFGSLETDPKIFRDYELGSGRKSQDRVILAIERAIRLVKPGGKIGIVVIDGILNNKRTNYVRDYLKRNCWIKGIISISKETFEGYGSRAKTSILLLERKEEPDDGLQEPVFMAIAKNTGYAPNGSQITGNELPDILLNYRAFLKGLNKFNYHEDSWVIDPKDRLDAEYYWKRSMEAIHDIDEIQKNISELLDNVRNEYKRLQSDIEKVSLDSQFTITNLQDLLQEVKFREAIENEKSYQLLGVRWWGEGAFIREERIGREIKSASLYKVSEGWIIYNRLFAFRGSFAILSKEHDGCYVSAEFPTFEIKPEIKHPELISQYIVYCLLTPQYLNIIDALSTGSTKTSRNRFNQKHFLTLKMQIPVNLAKTKELVELLNRANIVRSKQFQLIKEMDKLRNGIYNLLPIAS